jgi:transposase
MVKKRRKYTREFKLEAVRLSEESEEPAAEIARQLGIHANLLYTWRERFLQDGEEAFPGHGKLRASDDEMRRLRRELVRVREERDVLKKAIAFFAKESR